MPDNQYSDIIDLPHHVSKDRPHLSMHQRAAQFSPFAALVGYEDVVEEIRRQTDPERELNEDEKKSWIGAWALSQQIWRRIRS